MMQFWPVFLLGGLLIVTNGARAAPAELCSVCVCTNTEATTCSPVTEFPILNASITYLDLVQTQITSVGANVCNVAPLTNLILPATVVSTDPNTFVGCGSLTSLTMTEKWTAGVSNLPTFVPGLTNLGLRFTSPEPILANKFTGFPDLIYIFLSPNVGQVSPGAFNGLNHLKLVSISGPLTSIPLNVLPPTLTFLAVTFQATSAPSVALDGLSLLTALTISYSSAAIPTGAFASFGLNSLREVALLGITQVSSDAFSNLANLRDLKLNGPITQLASASFRGLSALTRLRLEGPLTTLPPGLFQNLTALQSVNFASHQFAATSTNAPPSTYGTASSPLPCHSQCATCYGSGPGACCPAGCLYCTSGSVCTQCYTQSCVDAMASIASDASVAFVSATSAASAASFAFVSATSAASAASVSIVSATSAASVSFVSATSAASVAIASAASVASAASDSATSAASISFASATSAASVSFASATSAASASFASATSAASVASVSILNLPPSSDAASAPIAAIAGAIAGVVLLLVVMALILRHRRRRQQAQAATIDRLSKSELVPIRESELSKISNVTNNTPTAVSQAPNRSTTVKAGVASPSTAESDYASVGQAFYATAGSVPSTYNYAAVGGVSTTYHYASTSEAASASKTAAAPDIKVAKNLYHAPADAVAPITYDYAVSPRIYDKPVAVTQTLRPGLVLGDKLGSGAFGVVLRGRIPRALVPADAQYLLSNPAQPDLEVAVKMLQPESGERAQQEFVEEARMVSQFDNPHIVRAIATLLEAKPHLCVLELMPHGDLRSVVHRSKQAGLRWTAGEFGHALAQVAAGLAYLESIRFVHRDIAARNCLVGVGLSVKISDFGLTRSLAEEHDYYKMEHKGRLPVKWMAPECLSFRKFSHQSDIWAFGVLAWETLSYGASPYESLPISEVLAHLEAGKRLECPKMCPPDVFAQVRACWEWKPQARPTAASLSEYFTGMSAGETIRDIGAVVQASKF